MRSTYTLIFLFATSLLTAQNPEWNSARIKHEMEKLAVTANVLYLAAHPDDENTRLIARLANEEKTRTAYLSLTRGDGGQNLIGDEKGSLLGLIRTQELLEARKIDGGEQYFSRALDFGYSKTPEETLEKWDRDIVLNDMVHTIREFKPDLIITRFPTEDYHGHGHHTASALLAEEAFDLAADPKAYPESAERFGTWKTKKLYFNASTWWRPEIEEEADKYLNVNVGVYNTLLGQPYTVIAAESRSRHRSQGFGALRARGNQIEYLELVKGEGNKTEPLFEGIDRSWKKIKGGKKVDKLVRELNENFDFNRPEKSLDALTELYFAVQELSDNRFKTNKINQIKNVIAACAGLHFEFLSDEPYTVKGTQAAVRIEALSQLNLPIKLKSISLNNREIDINQTLENEKFILNDTLVISNTINPPYWLLSEPKDNLFNVPFPELKGRAENPAVCNALFTVETKHGDIIFERDLRYKWRSRKDGELYRPFSVIPELTVSPDEKNVLFRDRGDKDLTVKIKSYNKAPGNVIIAPDFPEGWKVSPAQYEIKDFKSEQVHFKTFTVTPPEDQGRYELKFTVNGEPACDFVEVDYLHIEAQTVMPVSKITGIYAPIETRGETIGYIPGSGDEVPAALKQMGYSVDMLDPNRTTLSDLKKYDAVIAGIRAYNTHPELYDLNGALNEYVKAGGNYIVQYNTSYGLKENRNIGPYEFSVSRDRVTVEEAPVSFLDRTHAFMNTPNKLSTDDFDHWVQERGLYFPDSWSDEYIPLFAWNDPGEDTKKGSLITAEYGKGTFTYTGISFFRQLPAGVPGAFRLFANIIANEFPQKDSGL